MYDSVVPVAQQRVSNKIFQDPEVFDLGKSKNCQPVWSYLRSEFCNHPCKFVEFVEVDLVGVMVGAFRSKFQIILSGFV